MKVSRVIAHLRKDRRIYIHKAQDGSQWVGNDKSLFLVPSKMPELDEDSLRCIFEIPETEASKMIIRPEPSTMGFDIRDTADEEPVEKRYPSLNIDGKAWKPIIINNIPRFIDNNYLAPFAGDEVFLFVRAKSDGTLYLAVKTGFILRAVFNLDFPITKENISDYIELLKICEKEIAFKSAEVPDNFDQESFAGV